MNVLHALMSFLDTSPSPFHAVANSIQLLKQAGFSQLEECSSWQLKAGGKYFTTRNQTSIVAFILPKDNLSRWRMTTAHTDSPTYRIKGDCFADSHIGGLIRLPVEGYGGMIAHTWLDRPLGVAGRAIIKNKDKIETKLVCINKDLLTIPSLAIHMDRKINEGRPMDAHRDMPPLYGMMGGKPLSELIAEELGIKKDDIIGFDLSLFPRQRAVILGGNGEFIQSPRLDNLECSFCTLLGFLTANTPSNTGLVWSSFDNEEVGSGTRQGALSNFLPSVLSRIADSMGMNDENKNIILANSFLVSADNAHATHPAWSDKADPNAIVALNAGIVLKYNASQKYTTTGLTGAIFSDICQQAKVPVQIFTNRANLTGGSTLGNLLSWQLSIPMVDIGLAQLAMHSCVETAGSLDPEYLVKACQKYYSTTLNTLSDGAFQVTG